MRNIIYISFLILFSCSNIEKEITNEQLNTLLVESNTKYFETKDKKHLLNVYEQLKLNEDFREEGLSGKNSLSIISLLLNLEKYNELENLLVENKSINNFNRLNILNTVRFLKNKDKNRLKANSYIYENIKIINDSLNKSPQDSLLYADYFSMRMFLVGKKGALKEVDSMKAVNKRYSDVFYDDILKEAIESYPDEYLPK
jgi:hypothetical protein